MNDLTMIDYVDFAKVEFRVGEIVEAKRVEGSEKLLKFLVDFGLELGKKVVFSGIAKYYSPEYLLNKKTVFVVNIKPKKVMGELSEAMIFGASPEDMSQMSILLLDKEMPLGAKVF